MAEERTRRPASQYYWGDWWKDKGLHSCSLTARGLWHEMNTLMHEGDPYGHLTLNGHPMTMAQLANQCRITPAVCKKLLAELEAAGVFSRDVDRRTIFSRRMTRDERRREELAEIGRRNGQKGADYGGLGAEHGKKGGRPKNPKENPGDNPPLKPPQNPPPLSSSSSATSSAGTPSVFEDSAPDGAGAAAPPAPAPRTLNDDLPAFSRTRPPVASPPSYRDLVFGVGVPMLTAAGVKESNARSMLAQLSKAHGEEAVYKAVQQTAADGAGEPVSYIQRVLGKGKPRNRQADLEERNRAVAEAWAATGGEGETIEGEAREVE